MKVASTVLRGAGYSDVARLPDEALGGHVRRGEVGSLSVYYSSFKKTEANPVTGAEKERSIRFLRHYIVFNGAP